MALITTPPPLDPPKPCDYHPHDPHPMSGSCHWEVPPHFPLWASTSKTTRENQASCGGRISLVNNDLPVPHIAPNLSQASQAFTAKQARARQPLKTKQAVAGEYLRPTVTSLAPHPPRASANKATNANQANDRGEIFLTARS